MTSFSNSLFDAIKRGDLEECRKSVNSGADLSIDDPDFGSPLCQAVLSNQFEVVEFLVKDGHADVNQPCFNEQMTPLIAAILKGNDTAAKYLLDTGVVDVNYRNKVGNTVLMFAIKHGRNEIVERLVDHPDIDLSLVNKEHRTALMEAIILEKEDFIKLLLSHRNCDPTFENHNAVSALSLAQHCKNKNILITMEDLVLPQFQTVVGKILKSNKLRQHCERFYNLDVRTWDDAIKKLDDKYLSWYLRVEKQNEREKILSLFSKSQGGMNAPLIAAKVPDSRAKAANEFYSSLPNVPNSSPVVIAQAVAQVEQTNDNARHQNDIPVAKLIAE